MNVSKVRFRCAACATRAALVPSAVHAARAGYAHGKRDRSRSAGSSRSQTTLERSRQVHPAARADSPSCAPPLPALQPWERRISCHTRLSVTRSTGVRGCTSFEMRSRVNYADAKITHAASALAPTPNATFVRSGSMSALFTGGKLTCAVRGSPENGSSRTSTACIERVGIDCLQCFRLTPVRRRARGSDLQRSVRCAAPPRLARGVFRSVCWVARGLI